MKKILGSIFTMLAIGLLSGCAKPAISHKDMVASKDYSHEGTTLNVRYDKAVKNFKKGLLMCAENVNSPSLVRMGTGGVAMPGNSYYHTFTRKSRNKTEYDYRMFMGGVAVGECAVCQPEGGYYMIYTTVERARGNKTKLTTHMAGSTFETEKKAIEKWVKGDLSSCHGFLGKD